MKSFSLKFDSLKFYRKVSFFLLMTLLLSLSEAVKGMASSPASKKTSFKGMIENTTSFTLPNGMKFVVVPNHRAPVVVMTIVYNVGAGDDPQGRSGVAHLLEHLMFKGTPKYPDPQFKKIIARNGGQHNAFTSMDSTCYQMVVASDRLEKIMDLESDRMANLNPSEEAVAPELKVMLEEYEYRVGDNPDGQSFQAALASFFWNHPYRRYAAGWKTELTSLTKKEAMDFYQQWYAPNNACCFLVGDVDEKTVKALAEKYFGPLAPKTLPVRFWPEEPDHFNQSSRLVSRHERLSSASVCLNYSIPISLKKDIRKEDALDLLAEILGGGAHSRLYQLLVEEQKLCPSQGVQAVYLRYKDPLFFRVHASALTFADMPLLETTLLVEMNRVSSQGATTEELRQAKDRLILGFKKHQDDLRDVSSGIIDELNKGRTWDSIKNYEERIESVTLQDIKEVASLILKEEPRLIQIALPLKKREDQ